MKESAPQDAPEQRSVDDSRIQRVWTAVMSALTELGSVVANPDLERVHSDLVKIRSGGKLEVEIKSTGRVSRISQAEMMAQVAKNVLSSQPPNPDVVPQTEVFESF